MTCLSPRLLIVLVAILVAASRTPAAAAEPPVIERVTRAAEARALSPAVADSRIPAQLRGVVTAAEPEWQGKFVLQDESGGIFIRNTGQQPAIGDLVEVSGTTEQGWFVPVVQTDGWTRLGTAPLPPARAVSIERLMTGVEANQRIEITGQVRAIYEDALRKTVVEVAVGGYRIRVFPKLPASVDPLTLIAARVRIRGTAATTFNAARRTLTDVLVLVPRAEDFIVEEPETLPPFEQPTLELEAIARYRSNANLADRLHVKGILTLQRPGLDCFIQDASGGLRLRTRQHRAIPPGRHIEAVGFLEMVNFQPVLRDAVIRDTTEPVEPITPRAVSLAQLREGLHGSEWLSLNGTLLDRSNQRIQRDEAGFAGVRTIFTIRHEGEIFTAEYEAVAEARQLQEVPIGSEIEVDGIAAFETGDDGRPKAIALLMPSPASLRVLATPSWFTVQRLIAILAMTCVLLGATAAWLLTLSRKNAMLHVAMAEREKAQHELQAAHDQLEERVRERTEQLKLEMSVRKSAEVEFRAVLAERTRLARELHDTLEQALTGIALQLETAARLFQRTPAEAARPLELARGFLKQSQIELRRSIWDLRSRELERFDLAEALTIASRQVADGSGIRIDVATHGERHRLPEIVEENLLRIAQEALTNVVKHSHATAASVVLRFSPEAVVLEVSDNGCGLNADNAAPGSDRHFGLLGMRERAKRMGAILDLHGAPGEGTLVRITVAQAALAPNGSAAPAP